MTGKRKKISKGIGKIAQTMLNLTNKGAKKLEAYANKSAKENQNENAKKLAGWMNKLSQVIETKQEDYVAKVEANADEIINLSKKAFDKTKGVMSEMKQRADAAKEKAEQDATKEKSNSTASQNKNKTTVTKAQTKKKAKAKPAAKKKISNTKPKAKSKPKTAPSTTKKVKA